MLELRHHLTCDRCHDSTILTPNELLSTSWRHLNMRRLTAGDPEAVSRQAEVDLCADCAEAVYEALRGAPRAAMTHTTP